MKFCIAALTTLCLALAPVLMSAQQDLYDNGPGNDDNNAWTINSGYIVSDTFALNCQGSCVLNGFSFNVWEFPGDTMKSIDWSITSGENSGQTYYYATTNGSYLTDHFVSTNAYGYNIDVITARIPDSPLGTGLYWLNLQNAVESTPTDPVFWDENSGAGCHGNNGTGGGCPSMASDNSVGTIASEAFTILGTSGSGTTPEPSSVVLFGSGILGLAGVLRRRLF